MTPDTSVLEKHERRIGELETLYHAQDKYVAVLSSNVNNLSKTVDNLSTTVSTLDGTVKKASEEIAALIPGIKSEMKITKQWEDIYRTGFTVIITAVSLGVITLIFDYVKSLVHHAPGS